MQNPNIIATLVSIRELATRAFQFEHNKERYEAPANDTRPFTRENTPYPGEDPQSGNPNDEHNCEHRLELTFDKPPKNVNNGYVCGWGPDCDIRLVDRENLRPGDRKKVGKVSKRHISITFDTQRRVILRDSSTYGTTVSYDGKAGDELRSHFTWIIFPGYKTIEVSIPRADISFKIKLGKHESRDEEFFANVDRVFPPSVRMGEGGLATPLQQLAMSSQNTSVAPSGSATPRDGPIYLRHERIGKGTFGRVYRMTDVSTGTPCAGKYIDDSDCTREVAVLREVEHEHIVRFVNYLANPRPLIVMEYLPLGNLHDAHYACNLELDETFTVLRQALLGLEYMNSHGFIHRDLKPANMLLTSRYPISIKLADLGGAKHDRDGRTKFQTWIGTYLYASPEMYEWKEKPYTFAVDIWSLGIVVLELTSGLPEAGSGKFNPEEWFRKIFEFVQSLDSTELIDFVSENMLRVLPEMRLTASECLEEMDTLKLRLGIEIGVQSPSTREASQIDLGTPTEKASVLTTLMWESNTKRQRSPTSNPLTDFSKRTAIRRERGERNASNRSRTYPIANASLFFSGQQRATCESVLELLKDMQVDDEAIDSRTSDLVHSLCRKFERLGIVEVIRSIDQDAERTTLMAVTEAREFELASFTSSDIFKSVAELADHLYHIMDRLDPDPEIPHDGHVKCPLQEDGKDMVSSSKVRNLLREVDHGEGETLDGATTPTQAVPFPVVQKSLTWSTIDSLSWQSQSRGLTYPSTVSGCTIPS